VRCLATGYVLSSFYTEKESQGYGFRIDENTVGNLHHHLFHIKADLDIAGTSNRYETLNVVNEKIKLPQVKCS
jgi:diamine oxidase